ncbi:hypothetical protein HGRIS_008496 [Hohenbuehelia grisea]|uniref:Uncharacterized protein n=1 Tax=Hohenbuehelia grisea TaxID=104357 RepID=A0ABR3J871_9AGAR
MSLYQWIAPTPCTPAWPSSPARGNVEQRNYPCGCADTSVYTYPQHFAYRCPTHGTPSSSPRAQCSPPQQRYSPTPPLIPVPLPPPATPAPAFWCTPVTAAAVHWHGQVAPSGSICIAHGASCRLHERPSSHWYCF